MNQGVIIEEGTFAELRARGAAFGMFLEEFGVREEATVDGAHQASPALVVDLKEDSKKETGAVVGTSTMQTEEKNVGSVSAAGTLWLWLARLKEMS